MFGCGSSKFGQLASLSVKNSTPIMIDLGSSDSNMLDKEFSPRYYCLMAACGQNHSVVLCQMISPALLSSSSSSTFSSSSIPCRSVTSSSSSSIFPHFSSSIPYHHSVPSSTSSRPTSPSSSNLPSISPNSTPIAVPLFVTSSHSHNSNKKINNDMNNNSYNYSDQMNNDINDSRIDNDNYSNGNISNNIDKHSHNDNININNTDGLNEKSIITKVIAFGLNNFGQIDGKPSATLFMKPTDITNLILPRSLPEAELVLSTDSSASQYKKEFSSQSKSPNESAFISNDNNNYDNDNNNNRNNNDNNNNNNINNNHEIIIGNKLNQKLLYVSAGGDQSFAGAVFSDSRSSSSSDTQCNTWISRY